MKLDATAPAAPVEGFALETHDGLIFTVKGLVHPPEGTVAYLRYVPDPAGDRRREGRRYRRVYSFADQATELRARGLRYEVEDPVFGRRVQIVPDADVRMLHDPRARLGQVAARGPQGELEAAALDLCGLLARSAGMSPGAVGLTGSLLFGLQNAASDLDVVVYGGRECLAAHAALHRLMSDPRSPLRPPAAEELAAIAAAHRQDTPISDENFLRLQARKVNEGRFAGRACFVRFVRRLDEATESYGDPCYAPLGTATLRGRVVDASEAVFTPCRYLVGQVTTDDGPSPGETCEIASFRGRFSDQARGGERVHARGSLERLTWRNGRVTTRLTVGGPGDFLVSGLA